MVSVYEVIEKARKTGKVEKGTNEVTKAIERGTAKLVAYGADVSPKEIVQHLPILCKEKGIPCAEADKREKLGIAVGLTVACASVAIINAGDAEKDLESFVRSLKK
jgi:large subunit ribosomal protein L7Ae